MCLNGFLTKLKKFNLTSTMKEQIWSWKEVIFISKKHIMEVILPKINKLFDKRPPVNNGQSAPITASLKPTYHWSFSYNPLHNGHVFQIQIQIIYFKSLSYTWYFLNWKWYKQSTNYFTQKKKLIPINLTPLNYFKYSIL